MTNANLKQKQIEQRFLKQLDEYKSEARIHNKQLNASKISSKEKEKLELKIDKRFVSILIELNETARVLYQGISGGLNVKINYDKELKLLATMQNKLAPMVTRCVCNERNDVIDLNTIIKDTTEIFSEEILNQNISIKVKVDNKKNDLLLDELLLRQILANLLREAISSSKPGGKIQIHTQNEFVEGKEHLVVKITDDGFGLSDAYSINDSEAEEQQANAPLMLDSETIQNMIEFNGGQLEVEYMVGHGKTITYSLPYNKISYDNVIVLHKKD